MYIGLLLNGMEFENYNRSELSHCLFVWFGFWVVFPSCIKHRESDEKNIFVIKYIIFFYFTQESMYLGIPYLEQMVDPWNHAESSESMKMSIFLIQVSMGLKNYILSWDTLYLVWNYDFFRW